MSPSRQPLTMKSLEGRVAALERERNLYRAGIVLLVIAAIGSFAGVFAVVKNVQQTDDIKDAVRQIQQSRIVLSRESCRQRNQERAITRANLRQNLRNLAQVPDGSLEALGFTRREAVRQVKKQIRQVAPLDCKRLVRQVKSNRTAQGGGSGTSTGSRRPSADSLSEGTGGGDGNSGASVPERPSEPGGDRHKPGGGGGPPSGGGGEGPEAPSQPVEPPKPSEPENPLTPGPVKSIVDTVGQVVNQVLQQLP